MGLVSSLKNLNLNLSDLEELLVEHSIAAVTDEQGTIVYANKKSCNYSNNVIQGHSNDC